MPQPKSQIRSSLILARLGAERQEEKLAAQDSRRLREFVKVVEPVVELSVRCRLDDRELGVTVSRAAFVDAPPRGTPKGFVLWGSRPWPPTTPEDAEALATALSDLLDAGHFEAFLALINTPSHESRLRLLQLAGAPTDLAAAQEALTEDPGKTPDEDSQAGEPLRTPGELTTESAAMPPITPDDAAPTKTPLFQLEDLLVNGLPVTITGWSTLLPSAHGRTTGTEGGNGRSGTYGGHTDLNCFWQVGLAHFGGLIWPTPRDVKVERTEFRSAGA